MSEISNIMTRRSLLQVTGHASALADGALILTIKNASNADIDISRCTTAITSLSTQDTTASFAALAHQACQLW